MLAWSGGKDSAWALHALRSGGEFEIAGLFTTINQDTDRVAVHEVRRSLLIEQARAAGVALHTIPIPRPCPNAVYERAIADFVAAAKREGVTHVAFGDLFLEDVRRYRERLNGRAPCSIRRSSPPCRKISTPAARTASSTLLSSTARCCAIALACGRAPGPRAKAWSASICYPSKLAGW